MHEDIDACGCQTIVVEDHRMVTNKWRPWQTAIWHTDADCLALIAQRDHRESITHEILSQ